MSENIAGYIDRSYIKGQTYRYAANPAPVVFTGNIDEISDSDLLAKGMLVVRDQAAGTLPETGNTFLITTVKYGNNTYLQTAYLVQTGYECWEYRRIYSNGWTSWIGVDSSINDVDLKVTGPDGAKTKAEEALAAINGSGSSVGLSTRVGNLETNVSTIENTELSQIRTDIGTVRSDVNKLSSNIVTQSLYCASLNGLAFTKMAIASKTNTDIKFESSGSWYASKETYSISLSSYNFNSILGVFPGTINVGNGLGVTVYLTGLKNTSISYKLYRQTNTTIPSHTDAFLILGT